MASSRTLSYVIYQMLRLAFAVIVVEAFAWFRGRRCTALR